MSASGSRPIVCIDVREGAADASLQQGDFFFSEDISAVSLFLKSLASEGATR